MFRITLHGILSSPGCVFHPRRQEMKASLDESLPMRTQADLEYAGVPDTSHLSSWPRLFSSEHPTERFLNMTNEIVSINMKKVCCHRLPLSAML